MFVFSRDRKKFVNTDNITEFSVREIIDSYDYPISSTCCILADDCVLADYSNKQKAVDILKEIYDLLIAGANSYQIE